MDDFGSRIAVLEEQSKSLQEGFARIEGKLDRLTETVTALALDAACQRGRLHWLWVPAAAALAACATKVLAHYLP